MHDFSSIGFVHSTNKFKREVLDFGNKRCFLKQFFFSFLTTQIPFVFAINVLLMPVVTIAFQFYSYHSMFFATFSTQY